MKILFVGLGGAGQRHLRILSQILKVDAQLLAYRTRALPHIITKSFEIDNSQTLEEKYKLKSFFDLDLAINEKPDIAIISNPTSNHASIAMKLAQANCNLFVEKPLSHNLENISSLLSISKQKSLITYVGYQMRFHPCIRFMHEKLKSGALGKIISANSQVFSYLPLWHPYEDYKKLYAAKEDLGGGVVLTESHELDYAYWFFGMPQKIFASGGTYGDLDIDSEDTASIILQYKSPTPFDVSIQMSFAQNPPSRSCHVNGTKGSLVWDGSNKVKYFDSEKNCWSEEVFDGFERDQMFIDQLKHFLMAVEKNQKPLIDFQEGVASLSLALLIKESIKTGKVVVVR